MLSSYTDANDSSGKRRWLPDHAMSIYGYDSATGMVEIRNPWGTESRAVLGYDLRGQPDDPARRRRHQRSVDNMTTSNGSVVTGALVSAAAGLQANAAVTSFSIADTMADVSAAFTALAGDTKLTTITLTDATTPSLTLTAALFSAAMPASSPRSSAPTI